MRIVAIKHLTLDGVMQAPAAADEAPRGDFAYGASETPYGDDVMRRDRQLPQEAEPKAQLT
jgi:hypothetical protein